ncbi:DUF4245 domain-containing protein [Gordonia sp. PP30]|nr:MULTISPECIES: DUF4245 domain-containing protein [unclassified Gordonia (in: high G+C Gram-positive bacteria)]UQE76084.1 DUF4245 domain-containing protein [Gordonia sp. PP30]
MQDSRDMVWSLIPLLAICAVFAAIAGLSQCSFSGDAAKQNIPHFDSAAGFKADARTMPFPIREPAVPAAWIANSGSTTDVGSSLASNVGWITAQKDGNFVQLTQSGATEEQLARSLGGDSVTGTGDKTIAGHHWIAYLDTEKNNKVWITDLGDVRIAVLSSGAEDDMTVLAKAVLAASPLPRDQ